jgi:hypothetical protein
MGNVFRASIFLALFTLFSAHAAEDARLAVVERLYQDYAWETGPRISKRTPFLNEKSSVLTKYLTQSLARLLLEDRKCAERTREICQLDFSPIWNSQDPEGAKFRVVGIGPGNAISVSIVYPGQKSFTLAFDVVHTDDGWRINDIHSPAPEWSLRKILLKN